MPSPNGHCPTCFTPFVSQQNPEDRFSKGYTCTNGHEYVVSVTTLTVDTPNLTLVFMPNGVHIDFERTTKPDIDLSR